MKKTIAVIVFLVACNNSNAQPDESNKIDQKSAIRQQVEEKYSIIPSHWNGPEDPCCCLAYLTVMMDWCRFDRCCQNMKQQKED